MHLLSSTRKNLSEMSSLRSTMSYHYSPAAFLPDRSLKNELKTQLEHDDGFISPQGKSRNIVKRIPCLPTKVDARIAFLFCVVSVILQDHEDRSGPSCCASSMPYRKAVIKSSMLHLELQWNSVTILLDMR